jgi:ABC-type glycerol-3-phosphate transport system substrate-binding protein
MKNKRTLILTLVAVFALAVLLGPPAAQAQKELSVLTWNIKYFQDGFQHWVKEFNKIHPDIKITRFDKKGSEWSTYYQTQVVAGTAPDIIDVQGGLWLEYASKGGLVDLTPYIKRDTAYTSRIYPDVLKSWVYEGKNYGVPFIISKTLLFYNKLMMKEAGLSKLPFDWLYWPLFAMNGVELLSPDLKKAAFNTPQTVKALEKMAKATKDGAINKISWTGRWVEPNNAFAAGNIGILHAHAPAFLWMKAKGKWMNQDTVGATHLPGGWSTPNSHSWLISKSCKYPEAAWDFLKIASSGSGAYATGVGTNNLTGDKITNQELFKYFEKNIPDVVPVLKTQLEHLDKLCGNWPVAKDAEIKEAFYPAMQDALLGRKSAQDALGSAEKKVNRALRRR